MAFGQFRRRPVRAPVETTLDEPAHRLRARRPILPMATPLIERRQEHVGDAHLENPILLAFCF
jgi:hypothetical protein